MRKTIKKAGMAMGLLLLIGQFASCDTEKTPKMNSETAVADQYITAATNTKILDARSPVVFITGYDKGESNYYNNARNYFNEKGYTIVEGKYSLEEIITWMNSNATEQPYGEVHIVNSSNPYKAMNLETVVNGEKITEESLRKNIVQGTLPTLEDVVTQQTKIVFHSYGIGNDMPLMEALKDVFVAEEAPNVVASTYYNIFGGEFASHYLAAPFYVFYPTANSPGKVDLSKEIAKKYPEEKEIDWLEALNNDVERYVGDPYSTKFNVPIEWVFDYHNSDNEVPGFNTQEEVIAWIQQNEALTPELEKLKIPLEKFRWQWRINNSMLILNGKATVICVLKPLIKPYGDLMHIEPDTDNKRLYAMK